MQNRIERQVSRDEGAMFQPRLGGKDPVPWVAMFPFKSCREFGMQVCYGQGLQAAFGHSCPQLLWLEIKLVQAHLVVQLIKRDRTDED
jgi:hypothetical protein